MLLLTYFILLLDKGQDMKAVFFILMVLTCHGTLLLGYMSSSHTYHETARMLNPKRIDHFFAYDFNPRIGKIYNETVSQLEKQVQVFLTNDERDIVIKELSNYRPETIINDLLVDQYGPSYIVGIVLLDMRKFRPDIATTGMLIKVLRETDPRYTNQNKYVV